MDQKIKVSNLKFWQARRLSQIFATSLERDFSYFPTSYRMLTKKQNNMTRLAIASIHPNRVIYVVNYKKDILGYSIADWQPDGTLFIFWIYVDPNWRNRKIGKHLINNLITLAKLKKTAMIRLATHNYITYYKQFNFSVAQNQSFSIGQTKMYVMERKI